MDDEYCNETWSFRCSLARSALRPSNVPGLGLNASLLSAVLCDSRQNLICSTVFHQPAVNCVLHLPHLYLFFCISPLILPGGCSISPPVLFTPFVGFYLDCAVCPTSQLFPVSAGSKSAAQTMVRTTQLRLQGCLLCKYPVVLILLLVKICSVF